jgi:ketosteroid isomerase-like protein
MRTIVAAAFAVVLLAAPALASDKADVWTVVRQFADVVNKGDAKALTADCTILTSIIDDFPPHLWQGATACTDWASAWDAFAKKNGITGDVVNLGRPLHVDVTGDRAYVVAEANFTYKQNGKRVTQRGSVWTLVLQKGADGWRIAGWAWADR